MSNLRNRFERFCYRHRNWGIPNLMLYVAICSAIVLIASMFNGTAGIYKVLQFDKGKILDGQVWRLFTFIFTDTSGGFLGLIFLYFFYNLGRNVELSMGTFRFNLFYFSGVILMDVFAMIFCPAEPQIIGNYLVDFTALYAQMAFYLHLSLVLAFATSYPDAQFTLFFLIPVKAWILALAYSVLILIEIANMLYPLVLFPHCLFPLVGLLNFLLFAGKDVFNILPPSMRPAGHRYRKVKETPPKRSGPIPYSPKQEPKTVAYTHKCTVCGRTDVSNPELEFRYCSRCNGYHCYCEDHISNHTHIE